MKKTPTLLKSVFPLSFALFVLACLFALLSQPTVGWARENTLTPPEGEEIKMVPEDEAQIQEIRIETSGYMNEAATAPVITKKFKAEVTLSKSKLEKLIETRAFNAQKHLFIKKYRKS